MQALLAVESGVEQRLDHADDAVERRADLVAHIGEKGGFRPVGRLRRLGRGKQRAFRRLAIGDVERDGDETDDAALGVDQWLLGGQPVTVDAVDAYLALLEEAGGFSAVENPTIDRAGVGPVLGAHQIRGRLADGVARRRAVERRLIGVH